MASEEVQAVTDWSKNVAQPLTAEEKTNEELVIKNRIQFYDDHAEKYDDEMVAIDFRGPNMAAEALHKQLDDNFEACILDVGCGTGRVAELLLQLGPYTNLVGLEPSEGMVDVARKKNIYKEVKQQYMYLDCGLEHNTYDAVVTSGTFVPGHLKANCLIEMCNITKPGGYIVISMRQEHAIQIDDSDYMETVINKLVSDGKMEVLNDEVIPGYLPHHEGIGLDGHLYVFKTL